MKTAVTIIITILVTWFVTSSLNIDMPFAPEIRMDFIKQGEPKIEITPTEEEPSIIITIKPDIDKLEDKISGLIRDERKKALVRTLSWNIYWHEKARQHSEMMAETGEFEHSAFNVYENIFKCPGCDLEELPKTVINTWLNSPRHKTNLLTQDIYSFAVGVAIKDNIAYVTYIAE